FCGPARIAVRRVVVLPAGVPDARVEHARLPANEVLHPPETPAGEDCCLGAGLAGDLPGVVTSAGHDACSSVLVVSTVSNSDRYSQYPWVSSSETGMKRNAAEFMQYRWP